jgi:hypothetical protein
MISWLFNRCQHDYKEVDTRSMYIEGIKFNEILLYCPTDADNWRQKLKMERIKRDYKSI